MKHAQQIEDNDKQKDTLVSGAIDVPWARTNVEVQGLGLTWSRRPIYPLVSSARKEILHDVNIRFPAGEITAILVGHSTKTQETVWFTRSSRVQVVPENRLSYSCSLSAQ